MARILAQKRFFISSVNNRTMVRAIKIMPTAYSSLLGQLKWSAILKAIDTRIKAIKASITLTKCSSTAKSAQAFGCVAYCASWWVNQARMARLALWANRRAQPVTTTWAAIDQE